MATATCIISSPVAEANKLPASGSTIIFDRIAPGSYACTDKAFRVDVRGTGRTAYVHLTAVDGSGSTFDRGYDYARAVWRAAEA